MLTGFRLHSRAVLALLAGAGLSIAAAAVTGAPPQVIRATTAAPAVSERATDSFRGHDPFDDVATVEELRELEREVVSLVERLRPSVVMLRIGERGAVSTGTAVIIESNGLLATCGHVGQRAGRPVTAVLDDGTELEGHTLGQVLEGTIDCGLVQLDTQGRELPAAPLGSTRDLATGDWVIAMGYTHGLRGDDRPALTRVGRVLGVTRETLFFDAPIDAGDSGGPTFNLRGEVVGLNSRCGRMSWQNLATPIDRLTERRDELAMAQKPAEEKVDRSRESAVDEAGPSLGARRPDAQRPDARGSDDQRPEAQRIDERRPDRRRGPRDRSGRRGRPTTFPDSRDQFGKVVVERSMTWPEAMACAEASMLRVLADDEPVAYGVIVDAQGYAVTKLSQVPDGVTLEVRLGADDRRAASVVARDDDSDLALLAFDITSTPVELAVEAVEAIEDEAKPCASDRGTLLQPVEWAVDVPVAAGAVVLTPRPDRARPALGFTAIERRESRRDLLDGPYLGVASRVAQESELEAAGVEQGVTLMRVLPGTPAEDAGLKPDDLIASVNCTPIRSPEQLRNLLGEHRVGDRIELEVYSDDGPRTVEVHLARRGDLDSRVRRGNTAIAISRRSSGLGTVLAHDAVLDPAEVGGLIVDLDGRAIGMNIATYDRTSTHAIAAERMAELSARLLEQARRNAPVAPVAE